ncbi:arabinose efflux permease family protein [Burkholderia sp. Ch1-1]|uniref:MFS transporter n=1 Tax=Paraburkholderia sp. USG1 TaxID=2952268 RepID=UPI0001D25CE4|nr:MFS transporter [Paraburkholderia sp. USG1]EIF35637.1 arabinose efflux permease family protein [Burkholderia sp. Ch1-1]MDR8400530.1 MFS transporter [Paraburkholderia sp. USG1]
MESIALAVNETQRVAQHKKALVAACVGNFIEYYDFVIYGYFASVIARLFFPADNEAASLLLTFAVFAISYASRPLGGLIFGHLGDRYGRKTPLAVAVMLIACSTTVIGLLPTYSAIGIASPIILTAARLVQGISVGGEYGGATSFIAEYAPPGRRGFYTGWQTFTIGLALLVGGAVASIITGALSAEDLRAWGWRLPFFAGLPLGFVGLYLRLKLEETPHFSSVQQTAEIERTPLVTGLRREWKAILIGMGLISAPSACIYIYYIYSPTYLSAVLGVKLADAQRANLYSLIFYCALLPVFAHLSDIVGRRPLMLVSSLAIMLVTYPAFHLLDPHDFGKTVAGLCLMSLAFAPHSATALCAMAEIMPTKLRYTGLSVSLNIPVTLLGGTAPFIATYLVSRTGDLYSPAWFVIGAGLCTLVAAYAYKETLHSGLR